jgi:CheY-like chemotaxis protein
VKSHDHSEDSIRILIADDDERILECYQEAFGNADETSEMRMFHALDAELFDSDTEVAEKPVFEVVSCRQGADAISLAREAASDGHPFNVVILDVRMPPGIDGVEAGSQIREFDEKVEIVFVTGYSDVPRDAIERRVPPPMRLHYFNKPLSFIKLAKHVASIVKAH